MTSIYLPEKISKSGNNLSNLTRGVGEISNEEKKYDIILEENVNFFLNPFLQF